MRWDAGASWSKGQDSSPALLSTCHPAPSCWGVRKFVWKPHRLLGVPGNGRPEAAVEPVNLPQKQGAAIEPGAAQPCGWSGSAGAGAGAQHPRTLPPCVVRVAR